MSPNYLGTATGLTPSPLLISTLNKIQDNNIQTALREIQNWANSFYVFNYGAFGGNYVTGGVTVTFDRPYATALLSIVGTPFGVPGATSVTVLSSNNTSAVFQAWNASGEVSNGHFLIFFYIAIGH